MTSLRRTRRFSSSPTPSELQQQQRHDRDSYYDDSPVPDAPAPSSMSRVQDTTSKRHEGRSRSVRKTKSQLVVKSSYAGHQDEREDDEYRAPSPSRRDNTRDVSPNGIEYKGKRNKQAKPAKSRSPRSRDVNVTENLLYSRQNTLPDNDYQQMPLPGARFLVPKSKGRSQSRSPSPMPSYHRPYEEDYSLEPQIEEPTYLNITTRSTAMPRSRSRASSEAAILRDTHLNSGLPVSSSRAPSPLPSQALTPNSNLASSPRIGTLNSTRPQSPAIQASSRLAPAPSSLHLSTHRETPSSQSVDTHSRVTPRAPPQSRAPQASPVTVSSLQLSSSAVPRTLKDVTRLLEESRGRLRHSPTHQPGSVAQRLDEKLSQTPSPNSTPMPSSKRNLKEEEDSSTLLPGDVEGEASVPTDHSWRERSRLGLALTTEKGHPLGEPTVEDVSQNGHIFSGRRGTTRENPGRIPTSSQHFLATRQSTAIKPDSLTKSTNGNTRSVIKYDANSGSVPGRSQDTVASQVSAILRRGRNDIADERFQVRTSNFNKSQLPLGHARGALLKERPDLRSRQSRPDHGVSAKRLESIPTSAYPYASSLPKPIPKTILVSRQVTNPVRLGPPNASATQVATPGRSLPPKRGGSDAPVRYSRRTRKLVVRNPSPDDQFSSASSSNARVRNPGADNTSEDYTILALSGTQTSLGQANDVDYLVPDEVAAEVANDEERRRRALAGLVNDLHLANRAKDEKQAAHDRQKASRTRNHVAPRRESRHGREGDDDDDDDTFFAKLNIPVEDSLMEEPEPEVDGLRDYDDNDFDEDRSDYDASETDEDYEGDEDMALPPTPKFVHPLGEGDDLESRITRVTSLNRISPMLLPPRSHSQEQSRNLRSRPESPAAQKVTSTTSSEETPLRVRRNDTKDGPTRIEKLWRNGTGLRSPDAPAGASLSSPNQREVTDAIHVTNLTQEDVISSSQSRDTMMMTDNELSLVGSGRLSDVESGREETLSSGAKALFRQLQFEAEAQEAVDYGGGKNMAPGQRFHSRGETSRVPDEGHPSSQPAGHNVENDHSPSLNPQESTSPRTWRSTLPFGAYDSLAERHGAPEMRRQEVIWELCETELAFVKSLRLILRLFVQPLRHEDKTWIPGVPRDVTRLFDWFDDVMHLHSQISSALHAARSSQYPVVVKIAETLRLFVPRLELHQPYLVRLESVSAAIEAMSKDMHNEFGEFIRIQTASPECESMNLPSFLLKPVQRLMKYPLFFKRLWEFTPRSHPDHLPTFSLLHSTDMTIRVMQEVKAREEEYELVKNLASRIKGLPSGYQLARRERRLVAQGLLRRVILSDRERAALETATDARENQNSRSTSGARMTSVSSEISSFAGDWAHHPTKQSNMATFSTDRSLHADSIISDTSVDSTTVSRSTSRSGSSSLRGSLRHKLKESSVYAFVFTDLIILTTPTSERTNLLRSPKNTTEGKETWKLIDDLGVSRVLGISDQSGQLPNHQHLIVVELMSMTPNLLDLGHFADGTTANPVYLSLPSQGTPLAESSDSAFSEAKAKWLDAFERCFRFTLRSLSFPSYSGKYGTSSGGTDLELDTKSSVMSILSSGLPLPMSPSQQLEEAQRGRPTDLVKEEREERGWWSLRFHQVLKEVQRRGGSPVFEPASTRNNETRSKRRGKHSEPRPLILSPNPSITITPSRKNSLLSLARKKSK